MSRFVDLFFFALFLILLIVFESRGVSIVGVFVFFIIFLLMLFSYIFRFFLGKLFKINGSVLGKNVMTIFPVIGAIFCSKKVAVRLGYDDYLVFLLFVFLFSLIFSLTSIMFVNDILKQRRGSNTAIGEWG